MFDRATREKLRFPYKGQSATTEDLWDLNLSALDGIYKTLKKEQKTEVEESLLQTRNAADDKVDLQIAIVKHIFEVKQAEKRDALQAKERAEKKSRILEVLAQKRDESLQNLSEEELVRMANEL